MSRDGGHLILGAAVRGASIQTGVEEKEREDAIIPM